MTKYRAYGIKLTQGQLKKIIDAHERGVGITLKISKDNLSGNDQIYLTETQINRIQTANTGVELKLSKTQLDHMKKVGGFLPLLAAIPALLGAVGGLAGGVASAVNSTRQVSEQRRHNEELEKVARGGCINCGGFLMKKIGNGLYLEPEGSGVFLGHSPISSGNSKR